MAGFLPPFLKCTKTRQRNELRDCFTASLLNGSLVFFLPSQKPPKRSWWFYWPIWQVTTSGNLHISSINDQQESPLPISMPTRSNHVVICDKQQNHFEGGSQKKIGYRTRHKSEELWPMRYKHDNLRNVSLFATLVNYEKMFTRLHHNRPNCTKKARFARKKSVEQGWNAPNEFLRCSFSSAYRNSWLPFYESVKMRT